jgi:hypothetical protein
MRLSESQHYGGIGGTGHLTLNWSASLCAGDQQGQCEPRCEFCEHATTTPFKLRSNLTGCIAPRTTTGFAGTFHDKRAAALKTISVDFLDLWRAVLCIHSSIFARLSPFLQSVVVLITLSVFVPTANATLWWTNSMDTNALQFLYGLASDGDTVIVTNQTVIPTYTGPLNWNKAVSLIGPGTNAISAKSVEATGGGDPTTMAMFAVFPASSTPFVFANMVLTNSANAGACAMYFGSTGFRMHSMVIGGFKFVNFTYGGKGVADHNTYLNNIIGGQIYNDGTGSNIWWTQFPVAFTNIAAFFDQSDNDYQWSTAYPYPGQPHTVCASGLGACYIVRRSRLNSAFDAFSPAFDFHGDQSSTTDFGTRCTVIYGNAFTLTGSATMDKFVDGRGGMNCTFSNTISAAVNNINITYREEHHGLNPNFTPDPDCLVTNAYAFANTTNGQPIVVSDDGTGFVNLGVQYFTNAPTGVWAPFVPPVHPLQINDPLITNPASVSAPVGTIANFSTTGSSQTSLPNSYQWSKNGSPIAGATQSLLLYGPVVNGDNGSTFSVTATNLLGAATSQTATLTVFNAAYTSQIGQAVLGSANINK